MAEVSSVDNRRACTPLAGSRPSQPTSLPSLSESPIGRLMHVIVE